MSGRAFDTLLVANRGEIAVRIMRTARAMGLRTVAVYSDVDADAEHVRAADLAVSIGAAAPAESYLNIDKIIAAAQTSGAGAIHPGYGFLSENAALARACDTAGIVFVGPSAQAIETMGDKAAAKAAMQAAGVPVVPGEASDDQGDEALAQAAGRVGYPVMIKATAGGGGRGMRLVETPDDFNEALRSARSEARSAFGDDTVLLERAIIDPRHVEVQIIADQHGTVLHLGERDCSVQRRHQKLIEEAPSPAVSADLRERMGAASVAAAKALGYTGAGTFEYLLSSDGAFWFMEMNTRLQVEHPVTECVTGLDLVALQLRVAQGEALPLTQEDVSLTGHAIEVRLCAEDADAGFLPQSGAIARWRPAAGLRVDHALRDGAAVPAAYDSMIAKLVAHGPDRDAARARLVDGLRDHLALGLRTNQGFLGACLTHPVFAEGAATTAFIERYHSDLLPEGPEAETTAVRILAAILRAADDTALAPAFPVTLRFGRGDRVLTACVRTGAFGLCDVDGHRLRVRRTGPNEAEVTCDGVATTVTHVTVGDTRWLHYDGQAWDFTDLTFCPETEAQDASDGLVRASMNGTVASVSVAEGDRVEAGQGVLVLEAMKMEHSHRAPVSGTVTAIHTKPGAQVTAHSTLVEITPDQPDDTGA